jgi:hypothetical protein
MSMIPAGSVAPEDLDGFSVCGVVLVADEDRSAAYTLDDDLYAAPPASVELVDWVEYGL